MYSVLPTKEQGSVLGIVIEQDYAERDQQVQVDYEPCHFTNRHKTGPACYATGKAQVCLI